MERSIKDVYHITDRKDGDAIWTRIGVGFMNKDDSINILLDMLPLDGKCHVRERKKKEKKDEE